MPKKIALQSRKEIADKALCALALRYPKPATHLIHTNAWELMVATALSAQCTDARVNKVTPILFARWKSPTELAQATQEEVEEVVHSTGFYRNKAKNLIAAAKMLESEFNGEVPNTMEDLIKIPGVARKTANVVLFGAYGKNVGLAVDTHVKRITQRLGLTNSADPIHIEKDLMELFPKEEWGNANHRLVWFGRHVCEARNPKCTICEMETFCLKLEAQ